MAASSKTRVLHVIFSLEMGGMENGLVNVATRLPEQEFDLGIVCLERTGAFANRLPARMPVTVLEKPPGFSTQTISRLRAAIGDFKPDVVHTHNLGPLFYSVLARAPAILHGEHGRLPDKETRSRYRWLRRFLYARCRRVHTVSTSLRDYYLQEGFNGVPIEAVVNGVDTDRFAPGEARELRRTLGAGESDLIFGVVGRFDPIKRHAQLLEAFAEVGRAIPSARLLIVGAGGPEESRIRQACSAHPFASRIHLAGFQNNPVPYYRAMDLLVLPSLSEGFSNVVLEAMACGVPALCHDASSSREVIAHGNNGFIADLGNVESLASVMKQAASVNLKEIGVHARERVLRDFSIHSMVAHYRRLYHELAGKAFHE